MKWKDYIIDHLFEIIIEFLIMILLFLILNIIHVSFSLIVLIESIIFLFHFACFFKDYIKRKKFYDHFENMLNSLDQKYLITEMISKASFLEGKILLDSLYEINKSMKEKINQEEAAMRNLKEYMELWIHEIKLPISSLILRNHNKNNEDKKELEQIKRIENYIEQVLFYVRSEHASNDYFIHECNIKDIIKKIALKNKDDLLECNIDLETKDLDKKVYTDSKWLEFILNQIISNAIKYRKKTNARIEIETYEKNNEIYLTILDNGIGIHEHDIRKVFEKSFTGQNGHKNELATGMGLYLCKKMMMLLGHKIYIESKYNKYTKVYLIFGKDNTFEVLK